MSDEVTVIRAELHKTSLMITKHEVLHTYFIIVLNFSSSRFKSGVDSLEIMSGITL